MKYAFLLLLCSIVLASCKKDEPEIPFPTSLHHSGQYMGDLSLDTTAVTPQLFKLYQLNGYGWRICQLSVWARGPYLDEVDTASELTMFFWLSLRIKYSSNELNPLGHIPALTAKRLAQAINDGQYDWNDGSQKKDMCFIFCYDGVCAGASGGANFVLENPIVNATWSANTVRIQGSVDIISVSNPETNETGTVTDWVFDYTIAVD